MLYDPTRGSPERQFLMLVADEIERVGWCRGTLRDDNGRVCLMGGARNVLHNGYEVNAYHAAFRLLRTVIARKTGRMISTQDWNDVYCKDAAEAAAMLREAAMYSEIKVA